MVCQLWDINITYERQKQKKTSQSKDNHTIGPDFQIHIQKWGQNKQGQLHSHLTQMIRTESMFAWGNYDQSKGMGTTHLQHLSQKNLSSAFKVSVELKFLRQLVIELFCSMSKLRSKNVSSLSVTVSHLRHLVSLVNIPYRKEKRITGSSPRL